MTEIFCLMHSTLFGQRSEMVASVQIEITDHNLRHIPTCPPNQVKHKFFSVIIPSLEYANYRAWLPTTPAII